MLIPNSAHRENHWRVQSLAPDFLLEDVWQFPIEADDRQGHTLAVFKREALIKAFSRISERGPAAALFRLRSFLGRIFSWDKQEDAVEVSDSLPGSVRRRYLDQGGAPSSNSENREPDPTSSGFFPVYDLENESLAEIKNKTVHALMHLGWVALAPNRYTVQMAVYVKPNGLFGKLYMALIKPFRLWIVYPTIMRMVAAEWRGYQSRTSPSQ